MPGGLAKNQPSQTLQGLGVRPAIIWERVHKGWQCKVKGNTGQAGLDTQRREVSWSGLDCRKRGSHPW